MIRSHARTLPALLLGGLVGSLVLGIEFAAANLLTAGLGAIDATAIGLAILLAGMASFFAAPVFLLCFFGMGWPVWAMLHRLGATSPWIAASVGAGGAALVTTAFLAGIASPSLPLILAAGLAGAAGGLTVWRVAYSKPTPPPARPS